MCELGPWLLLGIAVVAAAAAVGVLKMRARARGLARVLNVAWISPVPDH